jgi:hypothetical protein
LTPYWRAATLSRVVSDKQSGINRQKSQSGLCFLSIRASKKAKEDKQSVHARLRGRAVAGGVDALPD